MTEMKSGHAHLIAGGFPPGSIGGHDHDCARLRLLGLLAEPEGDFRRLNYAFDSSTEIGIQSSGGESVRQARHRSIRISDGRSTPPRMAAVALKRLTASDQRRSS